MATKSAAKPKTKNTASRTVQKPAARKTAAKKTPAAKTATKKAAPAKAKTATKAAKKAAPTKTAAKKAASKPATAKRATAKAAVKKPASAKKTAAKTAPKSPAKSTGAKTAAKTAAKTGGATKKAASAPKTAPKSEQKKTSQKAASKTAAAGKKTASQKAAPAKTPVKTAAKAVKKPSAKSAAPAADDAAAETPKKPANVGQAPRKTTFAASIPVPSQAPSRDAPEADEPAAAPAKESRSAKLDFKVNDQIVYPAHGVGQIVGLEKQEVAGIAIELFVIDFDQEKMKLRVPTGKAKAAGMRPLSSDKAIKDAISTLKGRARVKRTMWSRRAQEYDAKINSGDIKLVAEVVRDLYRADDQPEQSYSERQLFEAALDRMAREVAAVRKADLGAAIEELESCLRKKTAAASAS